MPPNIPFWMQENASFATRVEQALVTLNQRKSGQVTENRTSTIGASEINGCARKVILSKLQPETFGYSTLAKFFRGHRQEDFNAPIHRIIASEEGLCWIPQLRVHLPRQTRCRAHVDNVYYLSPDRKIESATHILVVEEKNAAEIAAEPLDDYVAQLYDQMGLLKVNYPKAQVHGYLYQTDLNGEHTDYGGVVEVDMTLAENFFRRGEQLLAWLDAGAVPDPEPSLKCGWCPYMTTCPKWTDPNNPPLPESVVNLAKRYHQIKKDLEALEDERKAANRKLKDYFSAQGKNYFKGETAPGYFVQIYKFSTGDSYDTDGLEQHYPEIAAKFRKEGKQTKALKVVYKAPKPSTN